MNAKQRWNRSPKGRESKKRSNAKYRLTSKGQELEKSRPASYHRIPEEAYRQNYRNWNSKQSYLRWLAKALRQITLDALE